MVDHRIEETTQKIEDNDFAIDETTQSVPEQQQALPETKNNSVIQQLSSRQGRKRERSTERTSVDGDGDESNKKKKKQRLSRSVSRFSRSVQPLHVVVPGEGLRDSAQKKKAIKLAKKASKKRNKDARRGEADRVIVNLKPRHLFSGKRPKGTKHHR